MIRRMIYLIRHAEGIHNEGNNYLDPRYINPCLTRKGIQQSIFLRNNNEIKNPDIIITSPLARTIETAYHAFPDRNVVIDPLCREKIMFMCDRLESEEHDPATENSEQLMSRAKLFVEKLRDYEHDKIVVITHGKFINAVVSVVQKKEKLDKTRYYSNTEIVKIDMENDNITFIR